MKTMLLSDINSLSDPDFLALNADLIIEDDSLDELGERVVISADYEVEHEVHEWSEEDGRMYLVCVDDNIPVENASCYFTTTGDNPVIDTLAAKNDNQCRLLNEILPPPKDFYSCAKPNAHDKKTHRHFIQTLLCLRKNCGSVKRLRELWSRFWKKYFELKARDEIAERRNNPVCLFRPDPISQMDQWLKPWHIKRIRLEFNRLGIYGRKRK